MSGGGGGGSGTQQYNWNDAIAPYWQNVVLPQAQNLTDTTPGAYGAYKQYLGPNTDVYGTSLHGLSNGSSGYMLNAPGDPTHRIAGLTPDQQAAMQNISLYALDPTYGVQDPNQAQNAGINQEQATLAGAYLQGPSADPYAGATNPYEGFSPAFNQAMQTGINQITNGYNLGTAADTQRAFAQAGAFGGSANQQAVANNELGLGNTLNNYVSGMINNQWQNSGQLASQDLNRGSQAFQNERSRQIQALTPTQNEQNLVLQRGNAALGVGDAQRSYNQDLLNQAYTDYQNQQNHPYQMLDYLTGILGRAQGGVSPNMQYTTPGYAASPYSQILGAGLLGYGLTH